jgi:hypothetical protein
LCTGPDLTSEKDLDAFIRAKGDSAYHPSCTCKMGDPKDPGAVVGPDTKVLGKDSSTLSGERYILGSLTEGGGSVQLTFLYKLV